MGATELNVPPVVFFDARLTRGSHRFCRLYKPGYDERASGAVVVEPVRHPGPEKPVCFWNAVRWTQLASMRMFIFIICFLQKLADGGCSQFLWQSIVL